jgi:tetratricopeptide (TPR) repeat protein
MNNRIQTQPKSGRPFRFKLSNVKTALSTIVLQPPDTHYLSAAEGWLGLGNPIEANAEIERIRPAFRAHPDVLQVKCQICASLDKWPETMIICRTLTHIAPDCSYGWLFLSVALNKMDRPDEAREALRPAIKLFPNEPLFRYAMARYECRLGNLARSLAWLHDAMDLGDPFQFMSAALQDPGLEPLWSRLDISRATKQKAKG